MKVHLYTVGNCISCGVHKKEVEKVLIKNAIPLKIIDVDDEKYLYMALSAMRKYEILKTPAIVVFRGDEMIAVIEGIQNTIEKLERLILHENGIKS